MRELRFFTSRVNVLDEEPHTGAVARFHSYHVVLLIFVVYERADETCSRLPSSRVSACYFHAVVLWTAL